MLDQPRETVLGCTVVRVECVRPVPDLATKLIRKSTPRHVRRKLSAHVDGGRAEGLSCADPGARTPIGMSRFVKIFIAASSESCCLMSPETELQMNTLGNDVH